MFSHNNMPNFVCYPSNKVENFQDVTIVGNSKNIVQESNVAVSNATSSVLSSINSVISEVPKFASQVSSQVTSEGLFGLGGSSTPVTSSVSSSTSVVDGKVNKNICIDDTCLTEEDLKKLIKMIKNLPN